MLQRNIFRPKTRFSTSGHDDASIEYVVDAQRPSAARWL